MTTSKLPDRLNCIIVPLQATIPLGYTYQSNGVLFCQERHPYILYILQQPVDEDVQVFDVTSERQHELQPCMVVRSEAGRVHADI